MGHAQVKEIYMCMMLSWTVKKPLECKESAVEQM